MIFKIIHLSITEYLSKFYNIFWFFFEGVLQNVLNLFKIINEKNVLIIRQIEYQNFTISILMI